MIKFSGLIAKLTDEVCQADYLSLRLQEKYILEMASHKAPVPGEGYLGYMAANEIDISISLKKKKTGFLLKMFYWLTFRGKRELYYLCEKNEGEISLQINFKRPLSSPLLGEQNRLSGSYLPGKPLEKDWETEVYVVN